MSKILRLEDYNSSMRYVDFVRESGLAVWRIHSTLWLCLVISQGKPVWFTSNLKVSTIIDRKNATKYFKLRNVYKNKANKELN